LLRYERYRREQARQLDRQNTHDSEALLMKTRIARSDGKALSARQ
jgi:hypothetical protein